MKYIVRHTYTATENHPNVKAGTQQIWYVGKGGISTQDVKDFVDYGLFEGWSAERFAKAYIKKDSEWHAEYGNEAWEHDWEVMAY